MRDIRQLRDAVTAGIAEFGHLDIVLANAGIATMGTDPDEDEMQASWDAVIAVNLKGVWNTVMACIPPMIQRDAGQ